MKTLKHSKVKYLSMKSTLKGLLLILILMYAGVYAYASSFKPETMAMEYSDEKLTVAIDSVSLNQVMKAAENAW